MVMVSLGMWRSLPTKELVHFISPSFKDFTSIELLSKGNPKSRVNNSLNIICSPSRSIDRIVRNARLHVA